MSAATKLEAGKVVTLRVGLGHSIDFTCGDCGLSHRFTFSVPHAGQVGVRVDPAPALTEATRAELERRIVGGTP